MTDRSASQGGRPGRPTQWTLRHVIFAGGLALWLGSTLIQTRLGGIVALWTTLLLLAEFVVVTSATSTVTLADLIPPVCLGGAVPALAFLAGVAFNATLGTSMTRVSALGVPFIEETLKIAPVLWILWRQRHAKAWTMGVSDVLLLAVACGAGFGWVEDAFIRHNSGWPNSLAWLPTTEIVGDRHGTYLIAGHIIWTGLAGLTLGLGLLLRGPRLQMTLIGASGWLWSVIDHAGNNYGNHYRDGLSATLRFITANGWLTLYIFVLGVGLAVALDFYFAYVVVPPLPEAKLPSWPASWAQAQTAWRFLRLRRQFAYAIARYRRGRGLARARAASVAADVDVTLVNWQLWQAASGRPT